MKQVIKVSIAGVSFTLETDAHSLLEEYLEELQAAYRDEENSQEIIDDIEERIAELILEGGIKERVVSRTEIDSIIKVLGRPGEIKNEDPEELLHKESKSSVKKKLYRDLSNRVIGGVCSGLGVYFGADPVMVRLIFILAALALSMIGNINGVMLIVYLVMWIIVPAARTVGQKCAMYGCSVGIDDIPKRARMKSAGLSADNSTSSEIIRSVFNIIGTVLGIIMLLVGFAGLLGGMFLFFGFELIEGVTMLSVMDYVELGFENILLVKILLGTVYVVPFLGLLYLGLLLCFKFKSPAWHPVIIMVIVWIVALFALVYFGAKSVTPYWNNTTWSDDKPLPVEIDTFYLNLEPFVGIEKSTKLKDGSIHGTVVDYVVTRENGDVEFVNYPTVHIIEHTPDESGMPYKGFIECRYTRNNSFKTESIFSIKDSLITVYPKIYSKQNKFRGEDSDLWVHIPQGVRIIKNSDQLWK